MQLRDVQHKWGVVSGHFGGVLYELQLNKPLCALVPAKGKSLDGAVHMISYHFAWNEALSGGI